ncbi:MAG TPA: hypothetical protein VF180_11930, partial [Acidimicrobiia bacterium]
MIGNQHREHVAFGSLERIRIVLEQTAAMAFLRGVIGRPYAFVDRRPFPPDLTSEEIAYRIRLPGATSRPVVETMERVEDVGHAVSPTDVQPVEPGRPTRLKGTGFSVRIRLLRDATALAPLAGVIALVLAGWPMSVGGVLELTGKPGPNVSVIAPEATEPSHHTVTPQASVPGDATAASPIAPAPVSSET